MVIRTYGVASGAIPEIAERISRDFLPLIAGDAGLLEYWLIDNGDGHLTTIGRFRDRETAERVAALASEWVAGHIAEFAAGPPGVVRGDVLVHHEGSDAPG